MEDAMIKQTAQILYEACALDVMPNSSAALVDFGLDGWGGTNPDKIYAAYNKAVRSGGVTLEQLNEALGDGPKLSKLIGVTVKTVWDELGEDN
jgi:hypothetical protein